jgi:RNA polymerase sigma-70 factor, ECF subfamily
MAKRRIKIEENTLLDLLKTKSERGFSILYDNYCSAIHGVIFKIIQSEEMAEDLTQDVFVKIWHKIENFDTTKGTLFTWMINIARNTAIDKIRSAEYSQSKQYIDIANNLNVVEARNNNSFNIDTIGLRAMVADLRPEYKQIIDLVYFGGYTQAEIAEEYGIPLGTVKTRVKAAINNLRTILATVLVFIYYFLTKHHGY